MLRRSHLTHATGSGTAIPGPATNIFLPRHGMRRPLFDGAGALKSVSPKRIILRLERERRNSLPMSGQERIEHARRALAASDAQSIFHDFCESVRTQPARTALEVRRRRTAIGDAWEDFCASYLVVCAGYASAKRLADVAADDLSALGIAKRDVGIDIVACDASGAASAVQCKFRSKGAVSWRELSTFYALCARTGPWSSQIVMTNQARVAREGLSPASEQLYTRRHFQTVPRHRWLVIAGYATEGQEERRVGGSAPNRLAWLDRLAPPGPPVPWAALDRLSEE